MSDDVIREGDLVMVIKDRFCCPENTKLGGVFRVAEVRSANHKNSMQCSYCGNVYRLDRAREEGTSAWLELYRLKKINPPPVEESATRRESVPA